MRDPGAPARAADGDDVDHWTTERLARERALRAAVLIDAVRCLVGAGGVRERRARQSALRWLLSRDTQAPFSFYNVCEALGLDPSRLRRALLEPAFGVDGVPHIVLGGELAPGASRRLPVRGPRRDRARYVGLHRGCTR